MLYEFQFNSDAANEPFSFNSAKDEEVHLSQAIHGVLTGYRAAAAFGPAEDGVSFGRFPTSQGFHFVPLGRRTFGKDNPATTNEFRLGTGALNSYAKIGPVVISQIMYHPASTNDALEFVELHNLSPVAVPLYDPPNPANTWRLRKGIDFDFPPGMSLPASGSLIVVSFNPPADSASLATFQGAYGTNGTLIGPYNGKLNNGGETIELQKPDVPQPGPGPDAGLVPYLVVDRVAYDDAPPWPVSVDGSVHSLQKINLALYGNDPVNWISATPSLGSAASGDSDKDGMPNDWERTYNPDPNDPTDAATDSGGDRSSNLQKYRTGTNPRDAASALKADMRIHSNGNLILEFTAAGDRSYTIEFRDSLATGVWQKLTEINQATAERVLQLPITSNGSTRFFRVVLSHHPQP